MRLGTNWINSSNETLRRTFCVCVCFAFGTQNIYDDIRQIESHKLSENKLSQCMELKYTYRRECSEKNFEWGKQRDREKTSKEFSVSRQKNA